MVVWVVASQASAQALEDVPFITTPDRVTLAMLDIAQVGPSDHLIDLGSGDGRIVITAALRRGATGLGVEIVPELVWRSRQAAEQAGVATRVRFEVQDLFKTALDSASVITMYLLPDVNLRLRPALLALRPGTRIVSHDWDMGDWQPDESWTLQVPEKVVGREKVSSVHLWRVPAPMQGHWCDADQPVAQVQTRHQMAVVRMLDESARGSVWRGRIRGEELDLKREQSAGDVADDEPKGKPLRLKWEQPGQMSLHRAGSAPIGLKPCTPTILSGEAMPTR